MASGPPFIVAATGENMKLIEIFYAQMLLVVLVGIGGWIANIVKLVGSSFDVITDLLVGRVIGVFIPPVGSVLGFI